MGHHAMDCGSMLIEREIEIAQPIEAVFAFVADARNDVRWCPKVRSVSGGPDRYEVVHKPVPFMPARRLEMTRVREEPPRLVEWRQDDGHDTFRVTYSLSPAGEGRTRLRQSSDAELGVPRLLHPLWRHGIGRDLARQLRELRDLLESD
jgi:carbon monoxide dehydrogenase subunit G